MIGNHWLAAEVANVIHSWSRIERDLCEIFAYTIDSDNWTAAEILSEVRKFRPKAAILIRSIRRKFGQELGNKAKKLLALALEFSAERDVLAHGVFINHQDHKDCIVRIEGWDEDERWFVYDYDTLLALLDRLVTAAERIGELHNLIVEARQRLAVDRNLPAFPGQLLVPSLPQPRPRK